MEPGPQATVTFLSGPRDGETASLPAAGARGQVVIGRAAGCAVVLADDPDVSRRHARLTWQPGGWLLEDLGSRNGTFVGEFAASRRIAAPTPLDPGAVFRVGSTRLRLGAGAGPPEPARLEEQTAQPAPPSRS